MVYEREKKIKEKMADNKISRTEAQKQIENKNLYSVLFVPENSIEEFPFLDQTTTPHITTKPQTKRPAAIANSNYPLKKGKTFTLNRPDNQPDPVEYRKENNPTTHPQKGQEKSHTNKYEFREKTNVDKNQGPQNKHTITYINKEFLTILRHQKLSPEITPLIHKLRDTLMPLIKID